MRATPWQRRTPWLPETRATLTLRSIRLMAALADQGAAPEAIVAELERRDLARRIPYARAALLAGAASMCRSKATLRPEDWTLVREHPLLLVNLLRLDGA